MEPQPATDQSGNRGPGPATPRLWVVRDRHPSVDPTPDGPPVDEADLDQAAPGALESAIPGNALQAILDEGERGAARIAELSTELAERTAEVARCRAELIVARRFAELEMLRREVREIPDRVDGRLGRFRAGAREIAARLQGRA